MRAADFATRCVVREPLVLALAENHPLAHGRPPTLADFDHAPFLTYSPVEARYFHDGIAGLGGFALAPTGFWMWASLPVFSLWGLLGPGLQGLMSQRVAGHEQGKLQGANGSLTSIAGLIGPALFTQSFAYCIDKSRAWELPGAPFFLAALLLVSALLLSLRVTRTARRLNEPAGGV
jgi:LysR substrate binding domain